MAASTSASGGSWQERCLRSRSRRRVSAQGRDGRRRERFPQSPDASAGPNYETSSTGTLPPFTPSPWIVTVLLDNSQQDVAAVRAAIEQWFDDAMDRVSGWYKRHVQKIVLGLGFALAVLLNLDTLALAHA